MTSDTGVASILGFERKSEKDKPNGYAGLDASGLVPGYAGLTSTREIDHFFPKIASVNLRHSHDALATGGLLDYFKLKTFTFQYGIIGIATVKFDASNGDFGVTNYARIYKNGVAVGTQRSVTTQGMTTFTEDISISVEPNGTIELWGKTNGISLAVQNFRIYYDNAPDKIVVAGVSII